MRIVVDTNIIISALIKKRLTRNLLLNEKFNFLTPSFTLSEIFKHREEIYRKAKLSNEDFHRLVKKLFKYIKIVNLKSYSEKLREAEGYIKDIDDVAFLACAFCFNCPIWSDDKHFKQQEKIKIFTTEDILNITKE